MRSTKLTINEVDTKSLLFHFPTDNRHLNLNLLLKAHFTAPPESPTETNLSIDDKTNKNGNINKN